MNAEIKSINPSTKIASTNIKIFCLIFMRIAPLFRNNPAINANTINDNMINVSNAI